MNDLRLLPNKPHKRMSLPKAIISLMVSRIEFTIAERRAGITAIEAAEASAFEQQLRTVCTTPEGRQQLRDIAITAAQMGLSHPDEFSDSIRIGMLTRAWGITARDVNSLRQMFSKGLVPRD